MRPCEVCKQAESKYKCPQCRIPYCCVSCYKQHKESPGVCEQLKAASQAVSKPLNEELNENERQDARGAFEEDEEGYRIREEQIDRMVESKRLQEWLRDPRIREIIELVDGAEDREKVLDGAIENNKEFSDFVEQLADVINPDGAPL